VKKREEFLSSFCGEGVGDFGDKICLRLDEVDLEELLEVEVGDLGLVIDAEELREDGVGEDAALEVGVEARVRPSRTRRRTW
jgi:hypothetical protein